MANIGATLAAAFGGASRAVAAGAGDATEVVGEIIDLEAIGNPESAVLLIPYSATLTEAKTLTLGCDIDHGADSALGDAAQFNAGVTAAVVATGGTGGSTEVGVMEVNVNLTGAKRYVRAQYTPDLSHTSADIFTAGCVWVFGGFKELPQ
jgi:hypothetical protein